MPLSRFASTPLPPYYAVMFSSLRKGTDDKGYHQMADLMDSLSRQMPGYLGVESSRDSEGFGLTISFWQSEAAILAWREHAIHLLAQQAGRDHWYEHYELRVAKVERAYAGPEGRSR